MKTFTLAQLMDADDMGAGYCTECGAMRDCCEPDARNYECEECGANEVYGAPELIMMGLVDDTDMEEKLRFARGN